MDKRAEILIRVVPVALAGGGPVLQTIQIDEWADALSKKHGIPVRRIGVAGQLSNFVDEQITGTAFPLDRTIEAATTVSSIYHNASSVLRQEMQYLYSIGIRHFAGVCCGYTSYGPLGLKRALAEINQANPDDPMTGNVIVQDSSFPDTDMLSAELDVSGYPTTRFHGPSYESTAHLKIIFTLNASVPFEIALSRRIPGGCAPVLSTVPLTRRYIEKWQEIGKTPRAHVRRRLDGKIGQWERVKADDWVVPLLASDIWDPDSIGKWMTREQYDTVEEGTLGLVRGLCQVAEKTSKPVFLPLVRSGADFILSQNLSNVHSMGSGASGVKPGVVLLPYEVLVQSSFVDLIVGADLIINRAVQSNSFSETILAGKPQLVITMPAAGYMEAELMAQGMKQGLLHYNDPPEEIGAEIFRVLTAPEYRQSMVSYQQTMLLSMFLDPEINFGHIMAEVAGLSL
jgi:hypothetical protein